MPREELQNASDELRAASEAAEGELQRRLYDQSNQLAKLATSERGPDHGRLDRHMNILRELREEADDDVAARVDSALDSVREYRTGVEGI
jgi:hypothetical protein